MRAKLVVLFFVVIFVGCSSVLAQSPNGSISGVVFDPDKKVIPGAEILVVNDLTGAQHQTKTNGDGIYVVPNLPPGPYRIQVSKAGFKSLIKPDIVLNLQDAVAINFTLPIGATSVVVTVEGGAPLVDTQNASIGTVVDRTFVENTPLNGRSFHDLILLTPGVVTNSPQAGASNGAAGEFSVNGQRTEANYYTVDGVSANGGISPYDASTLGNSGSLPAATALGTSQGLVSVDALEEFRIQSSTYSAEYGRNPGGQFVFLTRSGTNEWHGTAFDYLRNDFFDANNWFNNYYHAPEPPLRQNDFGGTLGGPFVVPGVYRGKDRTFFFFSYEGLRLLQPQAATTTFVPDAALRTNTAGMMKQVVNAFPIPNGAALGDGLAEFIGTWSNPNSLDAESVRFDHNVSERLRLFFRFSNTPSSSSSRATANSASEVDSLSFTTRTYTAGATAALRNGISNEFRMNYSSNEGRIVNALDSFGGANSADLAKLQGIDLKAHPNYWIAFFFNFGEYPALYQRVQSVFQRQWNWNDSLNVSVGRHQLKFGADYRRLAPTLNTASPQPFYNYNGSGSVSANGADFAGVESFAPAAPLYQNFSAFAQDQWRVSPSFTISLGLRWDVNPAPGVRSGIKPYTVQGAENSATMTLAPEGTSLWQTSWHNFAPRVGAAYILRATPGWQTVVRGGAGIFYDTAQQVGSRGFNGPGYAGFTAVSGPVAFPSPTLAIAPVITNPPKPPFGVYAFPPHLQLPYTIQTNLSFEQELGKSQSLQVSYVAAFGRKLLEQSQFNAPNRNFYRAIFFQNGRGSDYNSLQVQYKRRLTRGLQALASYTWSHCFDYGSQNTAYPYVRGNCDYDVRNNASGAVSYELPNSIKNVVGRALLHDWGFDGRLTARSAFPVNVQSRCAYDPLTQQYECSGLDRLAGKPAYVYGPQYPGGRAINKAAFAAPAPGDFGSAGRNALTGFGAWQLDLAVRREFPLRERLKLQFRAESFNVLNHPNFGYVDRFFNDYTFGQARATLSQSLGGLSSLYQMGGPRSMQFALKLVF